MTAQLSPVLLRRQIGRRLRAAREEAGLTLVAAAPRLDLVRQTRRKGWWKQHGSSDRDFIALATGATLASAYEVTFVPGLLQTADYAWAVHESNRQGRPRC